jgi:AI-2 transport system permease protein
MNARPGIGAINGRELILLAACILAVVIFSLTSPFFGTVDNAATILRNSVELLLIGLGMTLLMAMAGIDVSIGIVMGLAAIAVGNLLGESSPLIAALGGVATGALLGVITATVVVLGRVPAIVATLGLLGVYRTAIYVSLGGEWLSGLPASLSELLQARPLGVPVAAIIIGLAYLAAWIALRRTPYGLYLLAIGNSEEKARLAGVAVRRVQFGTFVASGMLAGLGAVFYVGSYRNVEMTIGGTLALDAIAAVVLGGTSILGGRCSLLGTVLGVLLLRILQNGLLLIGVPSLWQTVVTGVLLILVLGAEKLSGRLNIARLGMAR